MRERNATKGRPGANLPEEESTGTKTNAVRSHECAHVFEALGEVADGLLVAILTLLRLCVQAQERVMSV